MGVVRLYKFTYVFALIAGFSLAAPAFATTQQCKQAAEDAKKECQAAEQARNAGDAKQSAQTGAGAGNDINQNCEKIGQDIAKQMDRIKTAKEACEAAKETCHGKCDGARGSPDPGDEMQPGFPNTNKGVDGAEKKCDSNIDPSIANMDKALAGLGGNSGQAGACKQASDKGQSPQMPQMQMPQQQQKDKKEAEKKEAMKCQGEGGHRYSDCNNYWMSTCARDMGSANCMEFASRYCGSASAGSQAEVTIDPSSMKAQSTNGGGYKTASVVVDKGGEGLGSGFCRMVTAYKFCQATGRGACPSCKGSHKYDDPVCQNDPSKCVASMSGDQLLSAKDGCPTDPMFLDPAVQKQVAAAEQAKKNGETGGPQKNLPKIPGAGGGAAGGGGGGGLAGGGAGGGPGIEGGTPESLPGGIAVGMQNGGGGGGNGGGGGTEDDDGDGRGPGGMNAQALLPATNPEGVARDVSNQFGPNIFSISTAVYREMCRDHRLTACRRPR